MIAARRIVIAVGLASGLLIGTPAWAGIEDALKALQAGDVVQAVAGHEPHDLASLFRRIWSLGHAGAEIPLTIEREGRSFEQKVVSSERNRFFKVPRMH